MKAKSNSLRAIASCVVGLLIASQDAMALNFTPTEIEWVTWPDYCRARYVVSGAGSNSRFVSEVPAVEVEAQMLRMGKGWNWLHHYCAALAYFGRAEFESSPRQINYWLDEAEKNFRGYHQRINPNHWMYLEVVMKLAQLSRKRGDDEGAIRVLNRAIELRPDAASLYSLSAMVYRDAGNIKRAIELLLQGNQVVNGRSAEVHYFLGLFYIELNDLDSAVAHAERAYELHYPLPGLAAKLRQLGRSLE
jgi:tetratricopeptide (TPR) repeat protein